MAPEYLPGFLPSADGSDPLFTFVVVFIIALFMAVGIVYLKLHSLPERLAHSQNSTQLQLIAVLGLLALLTHNNVFWVLALLLSVIRLPDFSTPLNSMAESLKSLAGNGAATNSGEDPPVAAAEKYATEKEA